MPPKERETSSVGRPAPPKPAVQPVKAAAVEEPAKVVETPKPVVEPAKVVPPVEEKKEGSSEEFVAATAIKYIAADGSSSYIPEGEVVTGFSKEEMVSFYDSGSIRKK